MEFTQEKIKEAFDKANPKIQEILLDTWITEDVSLIGKKAGLRIDKIDILIRIIGYVILNLIPLSKLIDVIEKETNLDKEKSSEVAEKIDEFIFAKIREKIRDENKNEEALEDTKDNNTEITGELRDSLIKDIEEHAEEFGEPEDGQSFSDMFNKNKTTVEEKKVDLYRENF
jgi:hypothetical protein